MAYAIRIRELLKFPSVIEAGLFSQPFSFNYLSPLVSPAAAHSLTSALHEAFAVLVEMHSCEFAGIFIELLMDTAESDVRH